jgi:hypothetical protein
MTRASMQLAMDLGLVELTKMSRQSLFMVRCMTRYNCIAALLQRRFRLQQSSVGAYHTAWLVVTVTGNISPARDRRFLQNGYSRLQMQQQRQVGSKLVGSLQKLSVLQAATAEQDRTCAR